MRSRALQPSSGPRSAATRSWFAFGIGVLSALLLVELTERYQIDDRERELELIDDVRDLIQSTYVHGGNDEQLLDGALHGMLDDLDPYSRYYDRFESELLELETAGLYAGIGVAFAPGDDRRQVLFALPDTPAERAGLNPGDSFISIDGRPVADMTNDEVRLSFASAGRRVEVEVENLVGQRRNVELEPASIKDPTVRHTRILDTEQGTAYVAVRSFTRRTASEFDAAIAELEERGMRSLVLDLRGNLGGVLDAALHVANRFLDDGVILRTETRNGEDIFEAEPDRAWLAGLPLAVLIDRDSGSSSEVLAGALQDHRVAVLVGELSYGKGTVQTLTRVPKAGGIVKLTTSLFRTPSGRQIERSLEGAWEAGLAPDVSVVLDDAARRELRRFLMAYSPPPELLEPIRAWEAEDDRVLLPQQPRDAQLEAALELLRGERPGPIALAAIESGAVGNGAVENAKGVESSDG